MRVFAGLILFIRANITLNLINTREYRMPLDKTDSRLLAELQKNAQTTAAELGEMLNLSPSQAARRRQRLETAGYIRNYSAKLDAKRLGLTVQAFVQVQMAAHDAQAAASVVRHVKSRPEVISAWTLTGEADYMLHVYCADLAALNTLIQDALLPHSAVARVQSQIVMNELKADAPLPV